MPAYINAEVSNETVNESDESLPILPDSEVGKDIIGAKTGKAVAESPAGIVDSEAPTVETEDSPLVEPNTTAEGPILEEQVGEVLATETTSVESNSTETPFVDEDIFDEPAITDEGLSVEGTSTETQTAGSSTETPVFMVGKGGEIPSGPISELGNTTSTTTANITATPSSVVGLKLNQKCASISPQPSKQCAPGLKCTKRFMNGRCKALENQACSETTDCFPDLQLTCISSICTPPRQLTVKDKRNKTKIRKLKLRVKKPVKQCSTTNDCDTTSQVCANNQCSYYDDDGDFGGFDD